MGQTFQKVLKTIVVLIGVVFVLLTALAFNHERRVSNDSAAVANLRTINTADPQPAAVRGFRKNDTLQHQIMLQPLGSGRT